MWSTVATWSFSLQATQKAAEMLREGADAPDAVERGIREVESDPEVTSVGKGGFLNRKGELELDGAIMDGRTLRSGAVAGLKGFEHPISVARAVMEKTSHALLVGDGAEAFAKEAGFSEEPLEALTTPTAREAWLKNRQQGHDTIGQIALDSRGHICVGTSTSGASMKLPGRVGDSPLIGNGFYAEDGVGAAAATGLGEDIMKTCCAFRCVEMMRSGMNAGEAVERTVRMAHEAIVAKGGKPDCIAMIAMDGRGRTAGAANHKGFAYTAASSTEPAAIIEVDPLPGIGV